MIAATDEFGSRVGVRAWKSLLRRLQEMDALFGTFSNQMGPGPRVCVLYSLLLVLLSRYFTCIYLQSCFSNHASEFSLKNCGHISSGQR